MDIEVIKEKTKGVVRFTIHGNIDESGAAALKAKFIEADDGTMKEAIFNFSEVSHIGSAGIGKLLLFYKDLASRDGVVRIENPTAAIHDLFKVLKLDTIFTLSTR
ncbi:MAG: anti-sigma factor antagonist [Spartobacteria bacterium]|nr:anti-sigma factor antagonist [Spartobacteria bacterium]